MARYSITNHDASVVLEQGDDFDALMSTVSAHSLFYPLIYNLDENLWYVLWDEDLPVDMWFYGDDEPEDEVEWSIQVRIFHGRDAFSTLNVRDEGE